MQIALVATLLFAVVWFVALRPKPADGGGTPAPAAREAPAAPGTEGLTGAVEQAEEAVATANGESAPSEAAAPAAPAAAERAARPAARAARTEATAAGGGIVGAALRRRQAVAIAFVDPRTADARAVREELRHVSRFGGRALALSVPISQLARYEFLTREIEVTVAPTVVIVSPQRTATTIVGFADRGEIEQGLADALTRRR
jgi:hypothetical protein